MGAFLLQPKRDVVEKTIPQSSASINISGSATDWTFGAWTQISAGLDFPFILCGANMSLLLNVVAVTMQNCQYQIGIGVAGQEQLIATGTGAISFNYSSGASGVANSWTDLFGAKYISAGTRIIARLANTGTTVGRGRIYLIGYDARYYPHLSLNTKFWDKHNIYNNRTICIPDANEVSVISGGNTWLWGSWTEMSSGSSRPLLIIGYTVRQSGTGANQPAQFEIGLGATGLEVEHSAGNIVSMSTAGGLGYTAAGSHFLPRPLFVKPGERISIRSKAQTNGSTHQYILHAIEL